MSYQGKHIIVTGGSKGIGKACALTFLNDGAKVSVLDIAPPDFDAPGLFYFRADVSSEEEVRDSLTAAITQCGEIDVLVNNAGIQRYGTVTATEVSAWDLVMSVNLRSAFLCAHYAIPSMVRKGGGVVVNVSSVQAFLSQREVAAYTTAKTALLGLTRSISVDYAPAIRCVAVCPGTIDTPMLQQAIRESPDPQEVYQECIDMHPLKKIGSPQDVADMIFFLASEKASFVTGQAYRVDGGLGITIAGSRRS